MSQRTQVIGGERLRVVEGTRGQPGETVVGRGGKRYRDGKALCTRKCLTRLVAGGQRYRRLIRPSEAAPGETFFVPSKSDREKAGGELDLASGWYKDGKRVKSPGRAQQALCTQPQMTGIDCCKMHGGKRLRGVANPAATDLKFSSAVGDLARAYQRHREGDPTDLSKAIALEVAVIEQRLLPDLDSEDPELRRDAARELAIHLRALSTAAGAQTRREAQLERLVREDDLKSVAYRIGYIVRDGFADLIAGLFELMPKKVAKSVRKASERLMRGILDRVQGEVVALFEVPEEDEAEAAEE